MLSRVVQSAVLSAAFLATVSIPIQAQQTESQSALSGSVNWCFSEEDDEDTSRPEIELVEVTFLGSLRLPISEQEQIAGSIKQETHGRDLDSVINEAVARARSGWQDYGYFKVEVSGDAKVLTSNPVRQRVSLDIPVDEGRRYRLKEITFAHNKAVRDAVPLRRLFPIEDGDIFSREKIADGLGSLRKLYGDLGYINFTSIPDTIFDDGNQQVSLRIDLDEGRRYYVGAIIVLGLDDAARQDFLNNLPFKVGQSFNERLWGLTWMKELCRPWCGRGVRWTTDDRTGKITLTFDLRPCASH